MGVTEDSFIRLPHNHRLAIVLAWLCDVEKVHEIRTNSAPWIDYALATCGLDPGYPWCAAIVNAGIELAGLRSGPDKGKASVARWVTWAKKNGRLLDAPERGAIGAIVNKNGTGHMWVWTTDTPNASGLYSTIEGNTNLGGAREGTHMLRRARASTDRVYNIKWW